METRPGAIVKMMTLAVLILCLALSWSPWYEAGTLGHTPEIVVSYPAARSAAYWAAVVLLAAACAAAVVASRDGTRRRMAWRGLSLAASAGAASSVVLGLLVEPDLATRLWGTYFAPVALVTADPQALLASGSDTFFVSPGYGFWAVLATTIAGVVTAIVGLSVED